MGGEGSSPNGRPTGSAAAQTQKGGLLQLTIMCCGMKVVPICDRGQQRGKGVNHHEDAMCLEAHAFKDLACTCCLRHASFASWAFSY